MDKKGTNIFIKDIEVPTIVQEKADAAFSKIMREGTDSMEKWKEKNNKRIRKHEKTRYHFRGSAAAAVCICILALGSITAVAAAYHQWSRSMQGALQPTPGQQNDLVENGITTIISETPAYESMKATSGNVTVRPLEIIADGHFVHLSFSVEGYTIDDMAEPAFEHISVYMADEDDWVNMSGGFYDGIVAGSDGSPVYDNGEALQFTESGAYIPHYEAKDGTLEFVMTLYHPDMNESLLGQTIHVKFENLGTTYKAGYDNVLDGTWSFDIPLSEKNAAEAYTLDAALGDTGASVKSVELSPISIKVQYDITGDLIGAAYEEKGFDEYGNEISSTFYTEPPEFCGVRLKDGTLLPFLTNGGMTGFTDESRTEYYSLLAFDRVIEPDRIDALLFRKSVPDGNNAPSEDNLYIIPFDTSSK